jgi:hypothetical protein
MLVRAGEGELLFPPLSHLEVVGEPTLREHNRRRVVVVSVRVNINQRSLTIEEMLRQRKQTVVAVGENLAKEIRFDLKLLLPAGAEPRVPEFDEVLRGLKRRGADWFNTDKNLKEGMARVLDAKDGAIAHALRDWKRGCDPAAAVGRVPESAPLPRAPERARSPRGCSESRPS